MTIQKINGLYLMRGRVDGIYQAENGTTFREVIDKTFEAIAISRSKKAWQDYEYKK